MTPAPIIAPTLTIRRGKANKRPVGKGTTLVDKLERASDTAAKNIITHKKALDEYVGERPFGNKKLSERQQVRRYLLIREDPNAWTQYIQQYGLKQTTEYALRMEKILARYPDEAEYFSPQPLDIKS